MLIRLILDPADEHRSGANQMRHWLSFQEHARRGNARDSRVPMLIVVWPTVAEALCGHSFSASSTRAINKSLDETLKAFAERRLAESYPYLILDARYEKVREAGVHRQPGGAGRGRGR
jgi:hypothetical protein